MDDSRYGGFFLAVFGGYMFTVPTLLQTRSYIRIMTSSTYNRVPIITWWTDNSETSEYMTIIHTSHRSKRMKGSFWSRVFVKVFVLQDVCVQHVICAWCNTVYPFYSSTGFGSFSKSQGFQTHPYGCQNSFGSYPGTHGSVDVDSLKTLWPLHQTWIPGNKLFSMCMVSTVGGFSADT
jgi:hypothetical protein